MSFDPLATDRADPRLDALRRHEPVGASPAGPWFIAGDDAA
jgi:hypothetical protein